ncbi:uncharacterized protein I206_101001 [Kwoniella pini CBS 10737]|uniref:Uncharacterized protein n=1 Tax=Kwoniella pini CBS 10737 TaxID=1296096 RepID=A0A1B9IC65_9TREE|nr:uncharacterized protein I206_00325 [Kwoniella pini CBS 10737]OCF53024.1 hypothetical protein I206_00325 [Kwoniella pini CBS 10737]
MTHTIEHPTVVSETEISVDSPNETAHQDTANTSRRGSTASSDQNFNGADLRNALEDIKPSDSHATSYNNLQDPRKPAQDTVPSTHSASTPDSQVSAAPSHPADWLGSVKGWISRLDDEDDYREVYHIPTQRSMVEKDQDGNFWPIPMSVFPLDTLNEFHEILERKFPVQKTELWTPLGDDWQTEPHRAPTSDEVQTVLRNLKDEKLSSAPPTPPSRLPSCGPPQADAITPSIGAVPEAPSQ